ncbi:hypothetical protein Tco_0137928 [Tanacetum coccineum]
MSTRDKSRLGYGNQIHEGVLSYEKEVLKSVFDSMSSDVEDSPVNDRFVKVKGMHAVPPPMIGNYMPLKSDFRIDELNFIYGPKQSKTSESDAKTSDFDSCETNSSVEILESVPEPVVVEPKVVSQPKVWSDAPIIEEYESDSDYEYVIKPSKEQEKPSFAFVNTVKHVKTPRKTVKEQNTCSSINTARQNLSSQKAATSTARKINTARPIVNEIRPRNTFYKSHSPIRRPFNKSTAPKANFTNHKVNTAGDKIVSVVRGYRKTVVKASTGSEGFHQIIDFLNASHIQYARIENPTIYVSFIKQFWRTATARTSATGEVELTATIDEQEKTITEASLRRHLKLEDNGGVTTLPNSEIFEQLALIGANNEILFLTKKNLLNSGDSGSSTAIPERQVYIRRSAEKRKDKGKAIMEDDESVQKKTKKQLEHERLRHEEAIRLQEQINKEERQRIARDAKIAKQLQEEIDIARQ